jgi:hypothetical protein
VPDGQAGAIALIPGDDARGGKADGVTAVSIMPITGLPESIRTGAVLPSFAVNPVRFPPAGSSA